MAIVEAGLSAALLTNLTNGCRLSSQMRLDWLYSWDLSQSSWFYPIYELSNTMHANPIVVAKDCPNDLIKTHVGSVWRLKFNLMSFQGIKAE